MHVFGCPVYVLDKNIADGKKIPHWQPHSIRSINVGLSPLHATTISIVINPSTGAIIPQFNVFMIGFAASSDNLPDFNPMNGPTCLAPLYLLSPLMKKMTKCSRFVISLIKHEKNNVSALLPQT
jgi:hypothetical protein